MGRVAWRNAAVAAVASVFVGGLAIVRWGLVAATVVIVALVAMAVIAVINRPPRAAGRAHTLWLAVTVTAFVPVALGLLIFAITPTYFRPLVMMAAGRSVFIALVVAIAATQGLVQLGARLVTKSQNVAGAVLIALAILPWCVTFALVLFGPPSVILASPRE
jgi:hypothetical protein